MELLFRTLYKDGYLSKADAVYATAHNASSADSVDDSDYLLLAGEGED